MSKTFWFVLHEVWHKERVVRVVAKTGPEALAEALNPITEPHGHMLIESLEHREVRGCVTRYGLQMGLDKVGFPTER